MGQTCVALGAVEAVDAGAVEELPVRRFCGARASVLTRVRLASNCNNKRLTGKRQKKLAVHQKDAAVHLVVVKHLFPVSGSVPWVLT